MIDFNPLIPMNKQDRISPYNIIFIIKQESEANKEKYQLGDYYLFPTQILLSERIVWKTVRRITYEILGVKGLTT